MRIFLFGLVGCAVGYYIGAYAACALLWPGMNLCGLTGVFITGPLGAIIGAVIGWRTRRRNRAAQRSDPA